MGELNLEAGTCYRFETAEEESAIHGWAKDKQYTPLIFTRTFPGKITHYEPNEGRSIWLSNEKSEGVESVQSQKVTQIVANIDKIKEKQGLIHFGMGTVSYLISNNGYRQILNILQCISDKVSPSEKILTAHLNPDSFDRKEYSNLCETLPLLELPRTETD